MTPHFQAESVPIQHPANVKAASINGSYNKIPLKYYKKQATPVFISAVFKPLRLPSFLQAEDDLTQTANSTGV